METTEKRLKKECNKRNYYCKKFATHTATGHGNTQEADFMIAKENVYFVECKECAGKLFSFSRLTQKTKLMKLNKKTDAIKPLVLINFIKLKKVILLDIQDFDYLEKNEYFKNGNKRNSFNIDSVPEHFVYNWNSIFEIIK